MQFRYEEDFIEAAVMCASRRRAGISPLQLARFHREREKLYGIQDPDERNTAFFKLHLDWFREWELESVLSDLLQEFPRLSQKLTLFIMRCAKRKAEEGAELYVNDSGQRSAIVALRPEALEKDGAVRNYLRHEFMHLNDMVDESFGYRRVLEIPGLNIAQQRIARERYRLLWDISIDGRLAARGQPPMQTREQHATAFNRSYSFWTEEKRSATFDSLWDASEPSHSALLSLIADPRGLREAHRPVPGAPCPLCEFPTFAWASEAELSGEMVDRIRAEFPTWQPEFGVCTRCLEAYQALLTLASTPFV